MRRTAHRDKIAQRAAQLEDAEAPPADRRGSGAGRALDKTGGRSVFQHIFDLTGLFLEPASSPLDLAFRLHVAVARCAASFLFDIAL